MLLAHGCTLSSKTLRGRDVLLDRKGKLRFREARRWQAAQGGGSFSPGHFRCLQLCGCRALLLLGVVTLDPQTASRSLVLSEDRRSVRYTRHKQNLPDSPLRFQSLPAVLGSPGFSTGRHAWQVAVQLGDGGSCTVGVAAEAVKRSGELGLSSDQGVWAVIISHQHCWASTSPGTDLPLGDTPRSVSVALDLEAGRVSLLNADTQAPIFTFTASFSGRVFPFFAVWKKGSCLNLL